MSDSMTPEKLSTAEVPDQTAFEQVQAFLKERGQLVPRSFPDTNVEIKELQYQRPDVYFLSRFSFPDLPPQSELIKNIVNLTIAQKQTSSPDSPSSDVEVTLAHKGQLKLTKRAEGALRDTERTSRVIMINPQSGKREKAIIEPFNPLGKWLNLSKDKWQESKDQYGTRWVTTSDQEARKIVGQLMMPEEMHRAGKRITNEPKISRRGFLALIGVGAKAVVLDSLLSHIPRTPSLSKAFWEQVETATLGVPTEKLKKEIEDRFQIEIVSPSTGVKEVEYNNEKKYPTIEWDNPRLKSLIHALSELPTHFYSPLRINDKEYRIRFALTGVPLWEFGRVEEGRYQGGFCACHAAENQLVVLDKRHLGSTFLESGYARETWFHEITHALTTPEIQKYVDSIGKPIGIEELPQLRKTFASEIQMVSKGDKYIMQQPPGASFLKQMPGRPFVEIAPNTYIEKQRLENLGLDFYLTGEGVKEQIIRVTPEWYVDKRDLDKYGEEFYKRGYKDYLEKTKDQEEFGGEVEEKSSLGYGAKNFYEFFSVAAEYYSKGRNEFVRTYERFLGRERAEKLYEGMKQEIFRGREY